MSKSRKTPNRRATQAKTSLSPIVVGTVGEVTLTQQLPEARFLSGSILRHVLVLTGTGAVGLLSLFIGDLANLLFLGRLGDLEVLAAVGFASGILFFSISIGIGMAIAATSVVSPAIGGGRRMEARRLATNALVLSAGLAALITIALWPYLGQVLGWLGATGRTRALGTTYLQIILPSFPLVAIGMTCGSILRSAGDAQRSMWVTLSAAIANVILDPVLIFGFGMGLEGAAWASVISRILTLFVGFWGVAKVHNLLEWPSVAGLKGDTVRIMAIGIPVVASNLATPAANAFVTKALAGYGDAAMAAWSVGGRVNPVAFGAIFAMTAAIGPIIGQNYGAHDFARVRQTVTEAVKANIAFTIVAWAVLALSPQLIIRAFGLSGDSVELIYLVCWWLAPLFMFLGFLFISNAVFNTLRRPHYATALNWARATLGTVPFVMLGGHWYGAKGVFTASMLGSVVFGIFALWMSYRLIDQLADNSARPVKQRI